MFQRAAAKKGESLRARKENAWNMVKALVQKYQFADQGMIQAWGERFASLTAEGAEKFVDDEIRPQLASFFHDQLAQQKDARERADLVRQSEIDRAKFELARQEKALERENAARKDAEDRARQARLDRERAEDRANAATDRADRLASEIRPTSPEFRAQVDKWAESQKAALMAKYTAQYERDQSREKGMTELQAAVAARAPGVASLLSPPKESEEDKAKRRQEALDAIEDRAIAEVEAEIAEKWPTYFSGSR